MCSWTLCEHFYILLQLVSVQTNLRLFSRSCMNWTHLHSSFIKSLRLLWCDSLLLIWMWSMSVHIGLLSCIFLISFLMDSHIHIMIGDDVPVCELPHLPSYLDDITMTVPCLLEFLWTVNLLMCKMSDVCIPVCSLLLKHALSSSASLHVRWQWWAVWAFGLRAEYPNQRTQWGDQQSGAESSAGGGGEGEGGKWGGGGLVRGEGQRLCGVSECRGEQGPAALQTRLCVWQLCVALPALPHLQGLRPGVLHPDTNISYRTVSHAKHGLTTLWPKSMLLIYVVY